MSLLKFIESIGDFFVGLFNSIEKAWKQLSADIQKAVVWASGVIAIINANIGAVPSDIWTLIETKYPGITQVSVTSFLIKANNTLNSVNSVAEDASFEDALTALQGYLSKMSGNLWIIIIKTIVAIGVDIFAPGTVIQKAELVVEYVYQDIIKPDVPVVAKAA